MEDDTNDIHIPSSFISRASFLVIRDLMNTGHSALQVLIEPDDGYDWQVLSIAACHRPADPTYRPLSDLLIFVMLLPSVITLFTILLNKYRAHRQVLFPPHASMHSSDILCHLLDNGNEIAPHEKRSSPSLKLFGSRNSGKRKTTLQHPCIGFPVLQNLQQKRIPPLKPKQRHRQFLTLPQGYLRPSNTQTPRIHPPTIHPSPSQNPLAVNTIQRMNAPSASGALNGVM